MPVKQAVGERPAEGMGGLAKGLAIVEALGREGGLTVADAARAAGATRAAARRCLLTLVDLGYAERAERSFRPLPRLRALGRGGTDAREHLVAASGPVLAAARDTLNESVSLAVLDGADVLFVARAEAEHIVSTGVRVGARLPAFCSATGRVLLAGLPLAERADRIGAATQPIRTPHTLTSPAAILAAVARVDADGFAISDEELALGMRSLAVPVREPGGGCLAALSVSAYAARATRADLLDRFRPVLLDAASRLERLL